MFWSRRQKFDISTGGSKSSIDRHWLREFGPLSACEPKPVHTWTLLSQSQIYHDKLSFVGQSSGEWEGRMARTNEHEAQTSSIQHLKVHEYLK